MSLIIEEFKIFIIGAVFLGCFFALGTFYPEGGYSRVWEVLSAVIIAIMLRGNTSSKTFKSTVTLVMFIIFMVSSTSLTYATQYNQHNQYNNFDKIKQYQGNEKLSFAKTNNTYLVLANNDNSMIYILEQINITNSSIMIKDSNTTDEFYYSYDYKNRYDELKTQSNLNKSEKEELDRLEEFTFLSTLNQDEIINIIQRYIVYKYKLSNVPDFKSLDAIQSRRIKITSKLILNNIRNIKRNNDSSQSDDSNILIDSSQPNDSSQDDSNILIDSSQLNETKPYYDRPWITNQVFGDSQAYLTFFLGTLYHALKLEPSLISTTMNVISIYSFIGSFFGNTLPKIYNIDFKFQDNVEYYMGLACVLSAGVARFVRNKIYTSTSKGLNIMNILLMYNGGFIYRWATLMNGIKKNKLKFPQVLKCGLTGGILGLVNVYINSTPSKVLMGISRFSLATTLISTIGVTAATFDIMFPVAIIMMIIIVVYGIRYNRNTKK
uniref:Uncharacterized protein n=1 Tax=Megaviridae environmental sample TaxID=1737588 RepID=A0A5J6VI90_9VIRU|nr:MAG: hypothetical protein [Megaviridae environmental sample]